MAGVLFIVTILTEAEEKKLNEPSYQLSSKDFSETLDEFENKENTDQANVRIWIKCSGFDSSYSLQLGLINEF